MYTEQDRMKNMQTTIEMHWLTHTHNEITQDVQQYMYSTRPTNIKNIHADALANTHP